MNRLLLPLAALLVCGVLSASASAMPVDSSHARAVAAERYYSSYGNPKPVPAPETSSASAPSDDGTGLGWAIAVPAAVVLMIAAAGGGALVGRAHAPSGHRLA